MTSRIPVRSLRRLLVAGWVLMMPPVPLGTALPPLSAWSKVAAFETATDCERSRETVRNAARVMITRDPGAKATEIAAAMGRLQAQCVERESAQPPAEPKPAAPPAEPKPEPKP